MAATPELQRRRAPLPGLSVYALQDYGLAFFTDDHGKRLSDLMKDFYYVYILVSETDGETHYTGITRDLTARLSKHNQGACVQTSKNRPWKIETAVAFRSEAKARRFERYLKTGSGREFARRHL